MGTHFLGQKRLKKYSNKFNIPFLCGYEYSHEKGYRIYILKSSTLKFVLVITKKNKYILKKLPTDFKEFDYDSRIRNEIEIDFSCDEPYLSTIYFYHWKSTPNK